MTRNHLKSPKIFQLGWSSWQLQRDDKNYALKFVCYLLVAIDQCYSTHHQLTTHHQDDVRTDDSFGVLPLRQCEQNGKNQLTSIGIDLQTRRKHYALQHKKILNNNNKHNTYYFN